jgi:hypothetical protein
MPLRDDNDFDGSMPQGAYTAHHLKNSFLLRQFYGTFFFGAAVLFPGVFPLSNTGEDKNN